MTAAWKRRVEKIASVVLSVLIALLILLVGYLTYCSMTGNIAFVGNYALVRIVSPSMEPAIPTGEYILVKKVRQGNISSLAAGDVILFRSRDPEISGHFNTHRIVSVKTGSGGTEFVTKGDNNAVVDPVTALSADVAGKYIRNLPALTGVARLFSGKKVFLFAVIIPAFILLVVCLIDLIRKAKEVEKELLVQQRLEEIKKSGGLGPDSGEPKTENREGK